MAALGKPARIVVPDGAPDAFRDLRICRQTCTGPRASSEFALPQTKQWNLATWNDPLCMQMRHWILQSSCCSQVPNHSSQKPWEIAEQPRFYSGDLAFKVPFQRVCLSLLQSNPKSSVIILSFQR